MNNICTLILIPNDRYVSVWGGIRYQVLVLDLQCKGSYGRGWAPRDSTTAVLLVAARSRLVLLVDGWYASLKQLTLLYKGPFFGEKVLFGSSVL